MLELVSIVTLLEDLPEFDELSARSRNLCRRQDILTLGKLLHLPDNKLMRVKNCGERSVCELQGIKMKYQYLLNEGIGSKTRHAHNVVIAIDSFWDSVDYFISDYCSNLPDKTAMLLDRFVGDRREFVELFMHEMPDLTSRLKGMSWNDFGVLRAYLEDFLKLFLKLLKSYDKDCCEEELSVRHMLSTAPVKMAGIILDVYPTVVKVNLEIDYLRTFRNLPTRVRNIFRDLESMDNCMPYLTRAREMNKSDFAGCGVKSFGIIRDFIEDRRQIFEHTLGSLSTDGTPDYYLHEYCNKYLHLYPFLTRKEQSGLAMLEIKGEPLPYYEIWHKYIMWNSHPHVRIMRDYLGLNREHRPLILSELRIKYGMTEDRLRHICTCGVPEDPTIGNVRQVIADAINEQVVSSLNPMWNEIIRSQNLSNTIEEVMGMVTMANSDYELIVLDRNRHLGWLINHRHIKRIRIRNVLSGIQKVLDMRRDEDKVIDVPELIRNTMGSRITDQDVERISEVILSYYMTNKGVLVQDGCQLYLPKNSEK